MGEQALCCEMVASSYVCQPSQSYADFMFCLHSDVYTCPYSYRCTTQCLVRAAPPREYPTLLIGLWPYSSDKIMYCTAFVCDANISQHKRDTSIHELRNTLLLIHVIVYVMEGER